MSAPFHKVCLWVLAVSTAFNLLNGTGQAFSHIRDANKPGLHNIGDDYDAIVPLLTGAWRAGYLTDQNIDDFLPSARLGQAQFRLAPTALMPQDNHWPAIIIDCPNAQNALKMAQNLNLKILYNNTRGLLLCLNPAAIKQP